MTTWTDITEAVGVALNGDKTRGADMLAACWNGTADEDHGQRCVISHYLADLQDDLVDEVAWDERALVEYTQVDDADLAQIGISSASGMAPSLHLNLGDGYLRQGRLDDARAQLDAGLGRVQTLAQDGYGAMIRKGLSGLKDRVEETSS